MIDLMIHFQDNREIPCYEQIYRFIKQEIREGRIRPGERLPSTRQLAQRLEVSRSTTQMAYDQLTAEGYLEARPCRGYFAAGIESLLPGQSRQEPPENSVGEPHTEPADARQIIDFSPRGIDLNHFPFATWRKISREVLRDENRDMFASGHPRGEWSLRAAISDYLNASRGIRCRPEQLIVGAGTEYLLMLLTQLTGVRRIAMEDPTYRQASRVLERLGHEILPIAMDRSGMRADLLEESGAEMAYIMPSHQFPTGVVMAAPRRQAILAWAVRGEERYLIEDDYDSEFRYRGRPIPAMSSGECRNRIIYLGTFSKAIAPAIRVSYMVLPERLNRRYEEICHFYASTVSRVDQAILTRFLQGGYFERHLNRMRAIYRGKHDCLLEALEPLHPEFTLSGEDAGLHVLLRSRSGIPERELRRQAESVGVRVYGLSDYFLQPAESCTVLLGYANRTEEEIRTGGKLLEQVWL